MGQKQLKQNFEDQTYNTMSLSQERIATAKNAVSRRVEILYQC